MVSQVIGRESELEAVFRFVDRTAEPPHLLVLEGDAGIGKSTLLREAFARAERSGRLILSAQPSESESTLPFTVLGDLLEPLFDRIAPQLAGPQRRALGIALLESDGDDDVPDLRAVSLGTLAALKLASADAPVLVVIDDVQWIDAASARVLEFVLRRLGPEPVRLLAAARSESARRARGIGESMEEHERVRLLVGPMSVDALDHLFRSRLGRSLLRPTLRKVHATSGGNPFFALELARALLEDGDRERSPGRLPVPPTFEGLVEDRLHHLSRATRQVLTAAAALSRPTVGLLRAFASDDISAELASAIRAGVIQLDGERVRFTHPILASAIYSSMPTVELAPLHLALARVVHDREERARHLALGTQEPNEEIATILDEAARLAFLRSAPDASAELAEHALRLTQGDRPDELARRGIAVADYQLKAGDTARARVVLERTIPLIPPGLTRSRSLHRLAFVRVREESFAAGIATLEEALSGLVDDPALEIVINVDLSLYLTQTIDLPSSLAPAQRALALAESIDDQSAVGRALTALAYAEFPLGSGFRDDVFQRVIGEASQAPADPSEEDPSWFPPSAEWAMMLKWSDRFDEARASLETLRRQAAEWHDEAVVAPLLFQLGELECWAGRPDVAARYASEARDIGMQHGTPGLAPHWLYVDALVAAYAGRLDQARAIAKEGIERSQRTSNYRQLVRFAALCGFIELSRGEMAEAAAWLDRTNTLAQAASYRDPGVLRFHADAIEALIGVGDLDRAADVLKQLEDQGSRLQRAWALATAARCRGLLAAARGEDGEPSMRVALEHHESVAQPFERGRTLLVFGTLLRRRGRKRDARETLGAASEMFRQTATPLWAAKAEVELARVSGRRPSHDPFLTPTERQIAELAAAGRTNREIADEAFMSVKTVETHLTHVYSKLNIRSRTELARQFKSAPEQGQAR